MARSLALSSAAGGLIHLLACGARFAVAMLYSSVSFNPL